jgi:hypothetical protein
MVYLLSLKGDRALRMTGRTFMAYSIPGADLTGH